MLSVQLQRKEKLADGIAGFTLVDPAGGELPAFAAGAHVDVHLPSGRIRQYSLCNPPAERLHYLLGVQLEAQGRGGSAEMHALAEGALLQLGGPRNLFPLVTPPGRTSVLLAGGIGITPLLAMAHALAAEGGDFVLHYCARSAGRQAFREALQQADFAARVRLHADDAAGPGFDPVALYAGLPAESHVYVCGPAGFMEAMLAAARAAGVANARLHREYFSAPADAVAKEGGAFVVRLAQTGLEVEVGAEESVAAALARAGVELPLACGQGVCGTCLTPVLEGRPEHRDIFMSADEHALNRSFTPCCSRSHTPLLVLDL
ncbi:2Fe-2S iron-sulfur cluster binding domain-containing protein [Azoarcus indigens]|uniref:Vanillate O-demethylase ferredoxin subunit n=1 Tax=Azoarcus indigens TaxID=29545 RepID=A0A4R6DMH5_9RHOO|nr:PDR/VanB family oxidoreductase [Azoarcus indigens]NMG66119.1 2Fe-2S iron-sulfur cluster binding domain-containing protein [Azoarcus indigens]TDN46047.1 vanillate O-demethylase ferredoxin subunit [Azoarcus indigens]